MFLEKIHLKVIYGFLSEAGCDPTLTLYLPDNLSEMNRSDQKHPCMVVCPSGAY